MFSLYRNEHYISPQTAAYITTYSYPNYIYNTMLHGVTKNPHPVTFS